jgi:hypothetical protein
VRLTNPVALISSVPARTALRVIVQIATIFIG